MARQKLKSAGNRRQLALGSAGLNGSPNRTTYEQQLYADQPPLNGSMATIFTKCRDFCDRSTFLSSYYPLKQAFWNYGFQIVTSDSKDDNKRLADWLASPFINKIVYSDLQTQEQVFPENNATVGEMIRKLCEDVWTEFLPLDNAVGLWLDSGAVPTLLPIERCRYQDKFGAPVLWYTHQLSPIDMQLLPPDQVQRFMARSEVLINSTFGEHFKVLTRGITGGGFRVPRLYSLLKTLGEVAAKEEGFYARSQQMKDSVRHHKLGHEISHGPHAGKGTWFWNSKRHDATISAFEKRSGAWDYTSNFDHTIEFPWPDVAAFDAKAWEGTDKRLRIWGGPLAQILINGEGASAGAVSEGAFVALKAQANFDRVKVRDFLKTVVCGAFANAPKECRIPEGLDFSFTWSDLIFLDPKQAVELWKLGLQAGPASVRSFREYIGLNHREENARKLAEAKDEQAAEKYTPVWDMSHGISPALGQTTLDKNEADSGDEGEDAPKPTKKKAKANKESK